MSVYEAPASSKHRLLAPGHFTEILRIATDPWTTGAVDVVVCDILGRSEPHELSALTGRVHRERPEERVVLHGHDTWGRVWRTSWPGRRTPPRPSTACSS
ncbi:hypothetical protein GCM10023175_65640 [Pseudonocardia xishanensis]|uniref:Pyruvate carboxyltransferase domain-containing protein n=1 Tax=Pseudonocardia xishanensis TaxID=630995 RepID=A0ABP8S491_9PSEU